MKKLNYSQLLVAGLWISSATVIQPMQLAMSAEKGKTADRKKIEGEIENPFQKACQNVPVVDRATFKKNKAKYTDKNCQDCGLIQQSPNISLFNSLKDIEGADDATRAKAFMEMVARRYAANLDKNIEYLEKAASCFTDDGKSTEGCDKIIQDTQKTITQMAPVLRRELALARPVNQLEDPAFLGKLDANRDINKHMQDFDFFKDNPFRGVSLSDTEMEIAKTTLQKEYEAINEETNKKMDEIRKARANTAVPLNASNEQQIRNDVSKQILREKRKKHKETYAQMIYTSAPIFATLEKTKKVDENGVPVWSTDQVRDAYRELAKNARKERSKTEKSIQVGKLEFTRLFRNESKDSKAKTITYRDADGKMVTEEESTNVFGERLYKSFYKSFFEEGADRDLLDYLVFMPVVESTLMDNPDFCGLAMALVDRKSTREMENMVGVMAPALPFFAFAAPMGVVLGGTAMTGVGVAAGAGAAMGMTFTAAAIKDYSDIKKQILTRSGTAGKNEKGEEIEVASQDLKKLEEAETALVTQMALHFGLDYLGTGTAAKLMYNGLKNGLLPKEIQAMAKTLNPKNKAQVEALNKAMRQKLFGDANDKVSEDMMNRFVAGFFRDKKAGKLDGLAGLSKKENEVALQLIESLGIKNLGKDPARALRMNVILKDAADINPNFTSWSDEARDGLIKFMQRHEQRLSKMSDSEVKKLLDDEVARSNARSETLSKEFNVSKDEATYMSNCPLRVNGKVALYLQLKGQTVACWDPAEVKNAIDKIGEIHGMVLKTKNSEI